MLDEYYDMVLESQNEVKKLKEQHLKDCLHFFKIGYALCSPSDIRPEDIKNEGILNFFYDKYAKLITK